jgi:putative membrane protein
MPSAAPFLESLPVSLPSWELLAHEGRPIEPHDLWSAWNWEPAVVVAIALAAWAYARGTRAVWRRAGVGRGVRRWQAVAFAGGMAALFVALVSPLHAMGEALFSAHMVQHLLLMLVAAPLLALCAPVVAFLWALPPTWRRALALRRNRSTRLRGIGRSLMHPLTAWVASTLALWVWHVPFYYDAAVRLEAVHAIEHVTFFLTALLFWWALVEPAGVFRRARGAALVYLFAAAMHSAILGALLTLAPRPWYTAHLDTTGAWGLSPLDDQEIAGGIMWVPANLVYLAALALVLVAWLRDSERRVERAERRPAGAGGGSGG